MSIRETIESRQSSAMPLAWMAGAGVFVFLAILSLPLFTGKIYIDDDMSMLSLPLRWFYQQCVMRGESFLWMPGEYCGFYLHGAGDGGMWHPLHWLLYRGWLPFQAAFNLELLSGYAFALWGTCLLFRRWGLPNYAALFGSTAFAFSGPCITYFTNMHMVAIIAHLPWLLLAIHAVLQAETRATLAQASLAIAILTASQLLLGHPQMVYVSSLVEAFYALFLLPSCRNRRVAVLLLGAKGLGLLLAGVQVLPTLDALANSYRANPSDDFRMAWSLPPVLLSQLVNAYLFHRRGSFEGSPYPGAVVLALACYTVLRQRRLGELRPLAIGAIALAVFGLVMALGKYGFVYRVWSAIPVIAKFRAPVRHLVLFHFGIVVLATVGLADLAATAQRGETTPWRRLWPLALIPLASIVISSMALGAAEWLVNHGVFTFATLPAPPRNILFGLLLSISAGALVVAAGRGRALALPLIMILAIADLGLFSLRHNSTCGFEGFMSRVEIPPDSPGYRIDPDIRPMYLYTCATMKGTRVPQGYCALGPTCLLDYYNNETVLRLAGVRWRKARLGGPPELDAAAARGESWYAVPDPMPRARLVTETLISQDPGHDITKIDIAKTALVSNVVSLPGGKPGEVFVTKDQPGAITVQVNALSPQLLVLNERYHEGWHAMAHAQVLSLLPVYGDFMGCVVSPGQYEVVFRFEPASYRHGKWVSLLGLLLAVAYGVALRYGPVPLNSRARVARTSEMDHS